MIVALTTLVSEQLASHLRNAGLVLADNCGGRVIITGKRHSDGSISDAIPAQEIVALDGNEHIAHTVALHQSGTWQPFNGVSFSF